MSDHAQMIQRYQFLEDGGRVQRYHTLDTLRTQTVAEHVYGMLSILTVLSNGMISSPLFLAALAHDAPEAITGDIPAPTKRMMRAWGERDVFADWEGDLFAEYDMDIVNTALRHLTAIEKRWIKMADVMEGLRFCQRETNLGNADIAPVALRYAAYLREMEPLSREMALARHLAPDFIPAEEEA